VSVRLMPFRNRRNAPEEANGAGAAAVVVFGPEGRITKGEQMDPINAERIAKIVARFDVPDVGEATIAWKLLRRDAIRSGIRVVDLLFRSDVILALDKQLEPERKGEAELMAKVKELSGHVEKLKQDFETARRRAEREQADFRRYHQMDIDKLQSELAAYRRKGNI
jgi:hypothetical protein